LQDRIDGFLFGIVDKSAGIDDNNIMVLCIGRFMGGFDSVPFQLGQQHFGVHQVFGAAHGHNIDLVLF